MKSIFRKNQVIITSLVIMIAVAGYLNLTGEKASGLMGDMSSTENVAGDLGDEFADIDDYSVALENGLSKEDLAAAVNLESTTEKYVSELIEDIENEDEENIDKKNTDKKNTDNTDADENKSDDEIKASDEGLMSDVGDETVIDTGNQNISKELAGADESNIPGEAVLTGGSNIISFAASAKLSREQTRAKNKETLMELINNENISELQKQEAIDKMIDLTAISEKETATENQLAAKGYVGSIVTIIDGMVDVAINKEQLTKSDAAKIEDIVTRKTGVDVSNIVITTIQQ